jgi:hypothetical protein
MWLRRFAKATRVEGWAGSVPSVLTARMSAAVASETIEELDVPQTREILLFESGALGPDLEPGTLVMHDGVPLRLDSGPTPLPSDRSWEFWTVTV